MNARTATRTPDLERLSADHGRQGSERFVEMKDVLDLPVTVTMEVGRTRLTIREFLQLAVGSVVPLNKDTSDAFDVLVNGALLAHGEVVLVNEKCGIRLTDVISPTERLRRCSTD
ncbi:MAG: flagellar motor switch protein FliN [Steroidobacteraceae bacterium]